MSKGKQVNPAEPVGITGSTGRSTGEHLHVTCKLNGKSIDSQIILNYVIDIQNECMTELINMELLNI